MRRLLVSLSLLVSVASFSQRFSIGPEVGINLVPMTSDTLGKALAPGWFGGANVEFKINDFLSARTGIYISQKQQRYEEYDTTAFSLPIPGFDLESLLGGADLNTYSSTKSRVSQYYLELPLLASANFKEIGVYAGPYVGWSFITKLREESSSSTPWVQVLDPESIVNGLDPTGTLWQQLAFFIPQESTYDYSNSSSSAFASWDFGFKFGLRYQSGPFGVNAFYNLGLLDYRGSASGEKVTHRYFRASINYNFKLGKGKDVDEGSFR